MQHFSPKFFFTSVRVNEVIFSNTAIIRYLSRLFLLDERKGKLSNFKHRDIEACGWTSGGIAFWIHIIGTTWT
jgi:hypothetical protein